jgi:hypothetical protein
LAALAQQPAVPLNPAEPAACVAVVLGTQEVATRSWRTERQKPGPAFLLMMFLLMG